MTREQPLFHSMGAGQGPDDLGDPHDAAEGPVAATVDSPGSTVAHSFTGSPAGEEQYLPQAGVDSLPVDARRPPCGEQR